MKTFYMFGNINPLTRKLLASLDDELQLKKQFAQKSILTFGEKGLDLPEKQVVLNNTWGEQQAYDELTKKYCSEILENPADYLIIDALGSVIPIYSCSYRSQSSNVTYSGHVKNALANMKRGDEVNCMPASKFGRADVIRKTKEFCAALTKAYPQTHIIVHEANYPQYYMKDGEVVQYGMTAINARRANSELLMLIYDCMKEYMPAANFIGMLPDVCAADERRYSEYDERYMRYLAASALMYIQPTLAQKYLKTIFSR